MGQERYERFRLTAASGLVADVLTLGATISQIWLPAQPHPVPVTCGPTVAALRSGNPAYLGAVIGRYSNRIDAGKLRVGDQSYQLDQNRDGHHLHGGRPGFHRKRWQAQVSADGSELELRCHSPAGEAGYPGTLDATAIYQLSDHSLNLRLEARVSGAPTPVSMTSHCYWQLAGKGARAPCELQIPAERVLETNAAAIPTGGTLPVTGTALDLRSPATLDPNTAPVLDLCYLPDRGVPPSAATRRVATLRDPQSGRTLHVHSNQPALQCYGGDQLDGSDACGQHPARAGLCLEPQQYPDAPNHRRFPDPMIKPGDVYRHRLQFQFHWPE